MEKYKFELEDLSNKAKQLASMGVIISEVLEKGDFDKTEYSQGVMLFSNLLKENSNALTGLVSKVLNGSRIKEVNE